VLVKNWNRNLPSNGRFLRGFNAHNLFFSFPFPFQFHFLIPILSLKFLHKSILFFLHKNCCCSSSKFDDVLKNVSLFFLIKFTSLFFYFNIWIMLYIYINCYFLNFIVENVACVYFAVLGVSCHSLTYQVSKILFY
jgi:hypothetical protein